MNPFFKKTLIAGLVSAAALTVGCTRTYEHRTAEQANYPATTNNNTTANADIVPDGTQQPNAELPVQTGPQFGAAGQTNDINADQDMTSENADELGYGGSGKAGMDGGMMMKHHGAMDGGMTDHGAMMDNDMMMDGGTMMDMDAGTKMKAGGKMKKK